MEIANDIHNRLKLLRERWKHSFSIFANILEIPERNYQNWEKSGGKFERKHLENAVDYYMCSREWLYLGIGIMYGNEENNVPTGVVPTTSIAIDRIELGEIRGALNQSRMDFICLTEKVGDVVHKCADAITSSQGIRGNLKDEGLTDGAREAG